MKKLLLFIIAFVCVLNITNAQIDKLRALSLDSDTVVYNGNVHVFNKAVNGIASLLNMVDITIVTEAKAKDAGIYEHRVKIILKDSSAHVELKAFLVILPAKINSLTFSDKSYVYDGSPKDLTVGNLPGGATVRYNNNKRSDVGEYVVEAIVSVPNYTDTILTAKLNIEPATITGLTFNSASFNFDNSQKSLTVGGLSAMHSVTYTNNNQINAGKYNVTAFITAPNYKNLELTAQLTINPLKFNGISFTDSTFAQGAPKAIFVKGAPSSANIKYFGNDSVNLGKYVVSAVIGSPNYTDTIVQATYKIAILPFPSIGYLYNQTFIYDGKPKSILIEKILAGFIPIYVGNGQTQVGKYAVSATTSSPGGIGPSFMAYIRILKATPVISLLPQTFVYNGSQVLPSLPVISGSTTAANLPYTIWYNGTNYSSQTPPTDAGDYTVTVTTQADNNHNSATFVTSLKISPATLNINFNSKTLIYNGNQHSLLPGSTLPAGVNVNYTGNNKTNAGAYTVSATINGGNNYKDTVLTGKLIVLPATLNVDLNNKTVIYNGNQHSLSVGNSIPAGVNVTYTGNDKINAGSYTVEAKVSGGGNYRDTILNNQLIISPKILSLVVKDTTVVYTGNSHQIKDAAIYGLIGSDNVTVAYEYFKNGVADNSVNAGKYNVVAKIAGIGNYENVVSDSVRLIIQKANPIITAEAKTSLYNGNPVAIADPVLSGTTTASGLNREIIYEGIDGTNYPATTNQPTNIGKYKVTVQTPGDTNHNAANVETSLIIYADSTYLEEVIINNKHHDNNTIFDAACNIDAALVLIKVKPGATLSIDSTFTVDLKRPGFIKIPYTVTIPGGEPEHFVLKLERKFNFDDIVVQKANNVFMLNLKHLRLDGWLFNKYNWYKNDQLIHTGEFYSAGDDWSDVLSDTSKYYVELISDTVTLYTCKKTPVLTTTSSIKAYPNPVSGGSPVTVEITTSNSTLLQNAYINLFSMMGVKLSSTKVSGTITSINAPTTPGLYILRLENGADLNGIFKIIVK